MNFKPFLLAEFFFAVASPVFGAVIGTNVPANPLTAERVAKLPAWLTYLKNSQRQQNEDRHFLLAELKAHGLRQATLPQGIHSANNLKLDHSPGWYAGDEARHIADVLVSFQTPAGGWSKNTDYTKDLRAPGEMFGVENGSLHLGTNDFDAPVDAHWDYVGTFDNDATTTELRFLAQVIAAATNGNAAWRESFLHGMDYVFAAQYPNGGWPQVWPLQGGYHDNVTFNDDAFLHILDFLRDVGNGQDHFSFVPQPLRVRAMTSYQHGMECLLAAQVVVDGKRTAWCQQVDAITLQPASARNYEMPSLASSESASIVLFLMNLPKPDTNQVAAVHAACAWFKKTKVTGYAYKNTGSEGRKLVAAPDAGPLWSRYYQMETDKPIFGDRDKSIHDDVNDLSRERRNGYGWYRDTPKRVLEHYAKWAEGHRLATN